MRNIILIFLISTSAVFAYNFDDVSRDFATTKEKQTMINIINSYMSIQLDEQTKEFFSFFGDCMESFDFDEIYESSYFTSKKNGFRSLCFYGHNEPEYFKLDLVPSGYDHKPINLGGDFLAEFDLKKNESTILGRYQSFSAYLKSKAAWKNLSFMNVILLLEGMGKIFDPYNLKKLNTPDTPLIKKLEKDAPHVYTNLSKELRYVFNEYTRSFPNNANFLYRYFIPKSPLEIFEIKSYNKIPYTHINAKLPINIELIEKDYPDLADYLEDLRGNFKISLKFKTKTGHTIGNAIINSTESIDFEAYTRSGKIIPFDSNGKPFFNEEFSGSSMKNYKLNVEIGIELKQY
ncbi:MAG: hypothetical protein GY870_11165, partial [archaeon]|nr:hypothetical protein [archaeon]